MARQPRKPDLREIVEQRASRRCEYCRAPQPATGIRYHLEHVFPDSLGGTDDLDNLALACPTCNYYKSNHLLGLDEEGVAGRPLFNPRKDRWDEHFEFDLATLPTQGKDGPGQRDDQPA
ncbi:MAG: HNH endonuclease [Verrucomicrobia bacterium]|nr:HNH endonuclease [Verrucomicrobiota bacterium]